MTRFELKRSNKRRRQDKSNNKIKLADSLHGIFSGVEDLLVEGNNALSFCVKRQATLLEDAPGKVKRLKDEGNTLAESGRFRVAMSRWQEALAVDPSNAALYDLMAQASMAVYEDFQAVQYALKTTKLAPTWSEGFLTLARCQLNFGELTLALEALKQAVEHNGGVETEEMECDRQDLQELLNLQNQVLRKHDEEAAHEVGVDKLQVISCFKHLSLRARAIELDRSEYS